MTKLLVDTNILIYGIDEDSIFYEKSRYILDYSDFQLVTTSKNLVEFLTVVTRSKGYGLKIAQALEILEEIIQSIPIIYPNQDSLAILLDLTRRYKPSGLKIHDYDIISIGLAKGVYDVATFNAKDFKSINEISLIDL